MFDSGNCTTTGGWKEFCNFSWKWYLHDGTKKHENPVIIILKLTVVQGNTCILQKSFACILVYVFVFWVSSLYIVYSCWRGWQWVASCIVSCVICKSESCLK